MPAYASHSLDYQTLQLGSRINAERHRQGLTLHDLGARAKISVSRLSQIENGHHILDAVQACVIAEALGLSFEAFLPPDVSIPFVIARDAAVRMAMSKGAADEAMPLLTGERRRPLAERFVGRHLEPLCTTVVPGGERYCYHHEHEFTFVLKGTIEFTMRTAGRTEREELGRGDCIQFRSSLPHRMRAQGDEPAECIQVISAGTTPLSPGQDWRLAAMFFEDDNDDDGRARAIGRELAALRESRGWSIDQVARMVGLKDRELDRIEAGTRRLPFDVIIRLARAFGKPLREFVRDT